MDEVMTTSDVRRALNRARMTIDAANQEVRAMADIIAGRLRTGDVTHHTLKRLKKDLEKYNMHTGRWSD